MDRVLGFDTSTGYLTVALLAGETVLAEREIGPDATTGRPRHARELLLAIEAVLAKGGGWESVGRIAVGLGPGTFTGLRIGISTARALAQSRDLPLVGVSSLRALAWGADGEALAVIDAKRTEAFAALYGADGKELWEPSVGTPETLAGRITERGVAVLAVGDGSVRFRSELESSGADVPPDGDLRHRVAARQVCRLAAVAPAGELAKIKPTYLRRPDAELWRERDRGPTSTN
ncbi:MAG: tRNA (adenosine(37)-N6)-threonylcarbamoyltransferase complex dimerization subunit type 1 TsaB [Actinomycetota bacterium]|nr:tRNA (adenosine(37)-N6)-threonylcarbamoyltransferase complex dimerization subunit type 1 TsaB [Actinomycetota bacterium]